MKKQVLALACLGLTTIAFAQKNEVKALEKAVKGEKYSQTASLISAAEKLITNADDKTKAKFYYLKAKAVLNGKNFSAIKNALADFDANGSSKYKGEIDQLKTTIANKLVNEVIANEGDSKANQKLETAYQLSGDQEYLYYAAAGYAGKKDYKKALPLFIELKNLGYTGEKTEYKAYNKETQKDDLFSNEAMRSLSLKAGTHIKPTETKTVSLKGDIVKNIAYMYVNLGETEKAIAAVKEARTTDSKDQGLLMTEANLYLKLDQKDKYKTVIEQAIKLDPTNSGLLYNLGVIANQQGNSAEAKDYYKRSLAIDNENVDANFNMAILILNKEKSIVEEMNNLGTSVADNKKYDALQEQRIVMYNESVPFLEDILKVEPKNKNAITTLKGIYSALGNSAKYKEMKNLLDTL